MVLPGIQALFGFQLIADVYLISALVLGNSAAALGVALALTTVFAALWLWLPWRETATRVAIHR